MLSPPDVLCRALGVLVESDADEGAIIGGLSYPVIVKPDE